MSNADSSQINKQLLTTAAGRWMNHVLLLGGRGLYLHYLWWFSQHCAIRIVWETKGFAERQMQVWRIEHKSLIQRLTVWCWCTESHELTYLFLVLYLCDSKKFLLLFLGKNELVIMPFSIATFAPVNGQHFWSTHQLVTIIITITTATQRQFTHFHEQRGSQLSSSRKHSCRAGK